MTALGGGNVSVVFDSPVTVGAGGDGGFVDIGGCVNIVWVGGTGATQVGAFAGSGLGGEYWAWQPGGNVSPDTIGLQTGLIG